MFWRPVSAVCQFRIVGTNIQIALGVRNKGTVSHKVARELAITLNKGENLSLS